MTARNVSPIPSVGRFAAAHGNAAASGETLVFESVPDGVRPAEPVPAVTEPQPQGKRFDSATGAAAARRRWALDKIPDFATKELEFTPAPDFAPFDQARREVLAQRIEDFETTFAGPVSIGVAATIRGWAWLTSFAEFYAVRAAKGGDAEDADRARRFHKDASIELAKAHELARAEAASRPRDPREHHRALEAAFGEPKGGSR